MKELLTIMTGLALITAVPAYADCGAANSHARTQQTQASATTETIRFSGVVRWVDLEGGFYALETDNGAKYDPMNLPENYRKDGLAVQVEGRIRQDIGSFRMYGKILEITSIRVL